MRSRVAAAMARGGWLVLLSVGLTAATFVMTPQSAVNGGLGDDGLQYAEMVRHFRGAPSDGVSSLAAYRPVAPALVAWSGLDVGQGFLALEVIASLASLVLLGALLVRLGVRARYVALALVWWAVLPAGIRYFLYVPVLTDGPAMPIMLALLLSAERRRLGAFAVLLAIGVLTRESLLAVAPVIVLADPPRGALRASARLAAVAAPALVALALVRAFPPMPVDKQVSLPIAAAIHALVLLGDTNDALRYLAALPIGFGALLVGPALAVHRRGPSVPLAACWTYLGVVALATAVVGGGDHDRYLFPLSIPLTVALFTAAPALGWRSWTALTALHLAAVRAFAPLGTDEAATRAYLASGMDLDRLAVTALVSTAAVGAAAAIAVRASRGRTKARPGAAPASGA